MKKYILFLFVAMLFSCQREEIPTYSGKDYIQFFDEEKNNYQRVVQPFSFCYSGSETVLDTVFLDVVISGATAPVDRKIDIKQVKMYGFEYDYDEDGVRTDSTLVEIGNQAIPGVHYVPFNDPEASKLLWIKKGEVRGKIGILLKRDISLKINDIYLNLEIVANDDFFVGDVKSIQAQVTIMDRLTRPEKWNNATGYPGWKPDKSSYWGWYGPVKHQFMIDYSPNGERWDDDFLEQLNKDEGKMMWYASFFSRKLKEVNEARALQNLPPLREDPNNPNSEIQFEI